jgi:hypothetical protein
LNGAAINTTSFIIGSGALGGEGANGWLDGASASGGLNDYARANGGTGGVPYFGISGSAARTVSLWFNAPLAQASANPVFVSWGSTSPNGSRFEFRLERTAGTGGGMSFPSNSVRLEIAGNFIVATNGGYTDSQWHNALVAFPGGASAADYNAAQFFVDGKLVGHTPTNSAVGINTGSNTNLLIGHGIMNSTDRPLIGLLDDVGIFSTALTGPDAALINGLGRIGGIGLDQLDEAQSLWGGSTGTSGLIGGKLWGKVTGLSGGLGDWGGTWASDNAFIVLDAAGNGIQLIPEPSSLALAALGLVAIALRRRRA